MTAYDMGISDWSSDVCSSDLIDIPVMQRYAQHDRYIDADEMAADIDTIGRNKAGHPKNYEDIVEATADQIDDRDVTLIPDRRYDRGHEFGRRGTEDRKSGEKGQRVSVSGELGGRRNIK